MATLALAVAGRVAGTAIGGPLGGSIGWALGTYLGNRFFSDPLAVEGPRLGDLSVTVSTQGAPIAVAYGTVKIGGVLIWAPIGGLEEVTHTESTSLGKGGGQSQETRTYSYRTSFAVLFAQRQASRFLRVWFDDQLVYDVTGSGQTTAANGTYRFYLGTETQLPDVAIQADRGSDNVPGYRGYCYMVAQDVTVDSYGARIPNVTAEIAFETDGSFPTFGPYDTDFLSDDLMAIDYRRDRLWLYGVGGNLARINLLTNTVEASSGETGYSAGRLAIDSDGYLYGQSAIGNSRPLTKWDPVTLQVVATAGVQSSQLSFDATHFVACNDITVLDVPTLGTMGRLVAGLSFGGNVGVARRDTMEIVAWDNAVLGGSGKDIKADRDGNLWVIDTPTGGVQYLSRFEIALAPGPSYNLTRTDYDLTDLANVTSASGVIYVEADHSLVIVGNIGTGNGLAKFDIDSATVTITKTGADYPDLPTTFITTDIASATEASTEDGTVVMPTSSTTTFWRLRLSDLEAVTVYDTGDFGFAVNNDGMLYHPASNSALYIASNGGLFRLYLDRATGEGELLSAVVTDLCDRGGLDADEIDVSDLIDDTVDGFVVGRPSSVRAALETLAQFYNFDAVESDDILKFRKRGGSVDFTIDPDWIGAAPFGQQPPRLLETRNQEVELPERIDGLYIAGDAEYETGAQHAKRVALPDPAMHSRDKQSVEWPIVTDATTARQALERLLFNAWHERTAYELTLPPKYLRADPTDVVSLTLDETAYRFRIQRVTLGADLSLQVSAVAEVAEVYDSTVDGDPGSGVEDSEIAYRPNTELFIADIPLLLPAHNLTGATSGAYFIIAPASESAWKGATVFYSDDSGVTWLPILTETTGATWGTLAADLDAATQTTTWDRETTITVQLARGELESVTEAQVLNGSNAFLIGDEIVQAATVTDNGDGEYVLSDIIRGRRGTEAAAEAGHDIGARVIWLNGGGVFHIPLALSEIGEARTYRAVSFGKAFATGTDQSFTLSGNDLKPFSPVHVTGEFDGSDFVITWMRRDRLGDAWPDGITVAPMSEASEAYEVDIMDGDTVVRTIDSLTSETATYLAADIATDFGSPTPTSFTVRVYQLSDTVGRGFAGEATI